MRRAYQSILIGSTLLGSCLGMQGVHELGHVLGAWATGGKVRRVVLSPTTISRTDVSNNSRPLIVAWAGPVVGIALPLLLWCGMQYAQTPGAFVLRFFAGFCLIVNGLYIGLGSFGRVCDWLVRFRCVTMPPECHSKAGNVLPVLALVKTLLLCQLVVFQKGRLHAMFCNISGRSSHFCHTLINGTCGSRYYPARRKA